MFNVRNGKRVNDERGFVTESLSRISRVSKFSRTSRKWSESLSFPYSQISVDLTLSEHSWSLESTIRTGLVIVHMSHPCGKQRAYYEDKSTKEV